MIHRPRPQVSVIEQYRQHYARSMTPNEAKALALAEAQHEADERDAIKHESDEQ